MIVKWIIPWKNTLAYLVKDAKSVAGFSPPANFESDGMTSHKHSLAAKYSLEIAASEVEFWASFETNFFKIAGTLEAEISVSGKTECSLAIGDLPS